MPLPFSMYTGNQELIRELLPNTAHGNRKNKIRERTEDE